MNSPVQLSNTESEKTNVGIVKRKTSYKILYFLLISINILLLALFLVLLFAGPIRIGNFYLEALRAPNHANYFISFGIESNRVQIKQPEIQTNTNSLEKPEPIINYQTALTELLNKASENLEQNTLLHINNRYVLGNVIPMSSIYEAILDASAESGLFATYKINEQLYDSLGDDAEWVVNNNNNIFGSPEIYDPSMHSLNIYKLDTTTENGYKLIASQNGNFKVARFFDMGNKLLAVERDYENNFYFYEYSVADNSFKKIGEFNDSATSMDYYSISDFSENGRFAILRIGYEFDIPIYVVNIATGYVDPIPRGNYKEWRLVHGGTEWLPNGNLSYNEGVSWALEGNYIKEDDLEWLVEYNPATRQIISRELVDEE